MTPGPWLNTGFGVIHDGAGRAVAECRVEDGRLIAAAPEMMELLREAHEQRWVIPPVLWYERIAALLARIESTNQGRVSR